MSDMQNYLIVIGGTVVVGAGTAYAIGRIWSAYTTMDTGDPATFRTRTEGMPQATVYRPDLPVKSPKVPVQGWEHAMQWTLTDTFTLRRNEILDRQGVPLSPGTTVIIVGGGHLRYGSTKSHWVKVVDGPNAGAEGWLFIPIRVTSVTP